MNISNFKIPKIRKLIVELIVSNKKLSQSKKTALINKAYQYQKTKLIQLYNYLLNQNEVKTISALNKFMKQQKSFKHGFIKLDINNINNYRDRMLYIKIAKQFVNKYPDSLYSFSLKYYNADNTLVQNEDYNLGGEFDPWRYTFQEYSRLIINNMVIQTTTQTDPYQWYPYLFLHTFNNKGYVIFKAEAFKKINNKDVKTHMKEIQSYQNNLSNTCVYDGCLKYFEIKMKNPNDKNAKAAYNKLLNSRLQYATSYTDETLCKIGQLIKASITIKDLVNGDDKEFNKDKFNRYKIEFMNTRYNHLELCTSSFNEVIELETKEELEKIKNDNEYYIEKYGSVYTYDNVYKVKDNEFKTIFKNWKKEHQIEKYSISTDSETFKFLEEYDFIVHRFINNMPVDDSLYKEIDLRKAYYNYSDIKYNKFYVGLPSGAFIHCHCNDTFDYNKLSKKIVGFFEVQIISMTTKLEKLGFKMNCNYILYSSMINLLLEHCELKFINATYCPSIHIPFNEDFLKKENENSPSYYCLAVGIFQTINNKIDTSIKVLNQDINYYSIINQKDCSYYKDNNIIHISRDNKNVQSYCHLALAIHSYNHTLVLNEMLNYNIEDILGVKLDSIIIKKEVDIIENPIFKVKEAKIEKLFKNWGYIEELSSKPATLVQNIMQLELFLETPSKNKINTIDYGLDIGLENISSFENLEDTIDFNNNDDIFKSYITSSNNNLIWPDYFLYTNEYIYDTIIVIGGKGGAGKTSSILRFLQQKITCYTAPCWNLIEGMTRKYPDIIGLSVPKLTGLLGESKVEKCYKPEIKFMIQDEETLKDYKKETKLIIKEYKHCFNFVIGDIDYDGSYYQCSMMNHVINPSKVKCQYVQYTKNFRFDDELNYNLDQLRTQMIKNKGNIAQLNKWFKSSVFKSRFFDINDIIYNEEDIGISCTNDMGDKSKHLSEHFIKKGAKEKYFIKNTILHKKMLRGAELAQKPDHKNYEMKLFKTIHSFQGLELGENNKIIIDLSCVFDYNLIYTALSRAKRMNQIFIITII